MKPIQHYTKEFEKEFKPEIPGEKILAYTADGDYCIAFLTQALQARDNEWREMLEGMKKDIDGEVLSMTGFPEAINYGYNHALSEAISKSKEQ